MIELIKLSREDNFSYCFHTAKVMNLFYKCDTLEYISYINTSIPLISKTLTSLNCWISLLSSSFMALQKRTGDEQKRKQRVLGVHTANTAGVSTAAHFARKARTTIFERTFAPQSLFLSANAGRGTTERGTRRNRTQGETRSNAGGRSLKSSKMAGRRIIVCCGASIVAHFARKVRATNT